MEKRHQHTEPLRLMAKLRPPTENRIKRLLKVRQADIIN